MRKIMFALKYFYHIVFSNFYHLGWRVLFGNQVEIINPKSISIGKDVSINNGCTIAVIDKHLHYKYKFKKPAIIIGDNVGIGKGTNIYSLKKIHIKDDVMIGPNCFIVDYDHDYKNSKLPIVKQPLVSKGPIIIEEGSWLGAHVIVCSGVRIGKNSVIGANSVVTKDIPANSVAVGSPAKVIKKNI